MGSFLKGSGPSVQSPFSGKDVDFKNMLEKLIGGQAGNKKDTALRSDVESQLLGFNPGSYFSGGAGKAGGKPSKNAAQDVLDQTIQGDFLDPTKNPFYNAMTSSATDAAQKFLNKNLDTISSDFNKASGGVASSSASAAEKSRSTENVSSQLGGTLADLQEKLYGQERGFQEQAVGTGLDAMFKKLGLEQNFGQMDIGNALSLLSAIRGIPQQAQPSPFGQLLGGGGSFLSGLAPFLTSSGGAGAGAAGAAEAAAPILFA